MNSFFFFSFYKKTAGGAAIKSKNILNQNLAEELYKSIIRKFKKCKAHSSFKDNVWVQI